jgi:hypothetical protein
MPKGGVADVMSKRSGFNQIAIQAEAGSDSRGELHHFNGVCQPLTQLIVVVSWK